MRLLESGVGQSMGWQASGAWEVSVVSAGRTRTVLRWPAGLAALVIVLAAAGSAPAQAGPGDDEALYAQCRKAVQDLTEQYRQVENAGFSLACTRPDGTIADPKLWWPAAQNRPAPTPPITADPAGCVTGPGRPVVDTTLTSVLATAGPGEAIIYQYQQLDGGEPINVSSETETLSFEPGYLTPGGSYRWRARVDDTEEQARDPISFGVPDDEQGWSPWCEFTVAADAIDYRGLGDVRLEALNELGLRPDRTYTITLTGRQQRLLRAGTNVGRTHTRMTLTGPRWTDLLLQLTESAFIADEVAAETDEDDPTAPDSTPYRKLVDAISVKLGGPHHPQFGG
ncbi:hypothetical protein [Actinoplanes sp. NPDC049118]|uniref:hypothetical protein n=1 Tax=Actinoplanes sp. NPDC049118 TaxID=3155769 RepID=UPI0033D6BF78